MTAKAHNSHITGLCELGACHGFDKGFEGYATPNAREFAEAFISEFRCNNPAVRMSEEHWREFSTELARAVMKRL